MAGYFGTEVQVRLQRRADERAAWTRTTPGACRNPRMLTTDDIDRLGWDTILDILGEDGGVGFRMMPADQAPIVTAMLAERGYRIDFWDTFIADKATALNRTAGILARGLPSDLALLDMTLAADAPIIRHAQEFMAANGIAPFSASSLVGEIVPAITIALADAGGAIVATAHAYLPHNLHSPYHKAAWGGLVAVAESQRGRKLGSYINAMMVQAAFEHLAADTIYELASATNLPSRRMIESCGLALAPGLKSALATRAGEKFTR